MLQKGIKEGKVESNEKVNDAGKGTIYMQSTWARNSLVPCQVLVSVTVVHPKTFHWQAA